MKRGIALAGGGARGAYEMGALKALKEMGYLDDIDVISGVSVGSLNACILAMEAFEEGEKLWLSDRSEAFFTKPPSFFKKLLNENIKLLDKGIYATDELEKTIDEMIDFDKVRKKHVLVGLSHMGEKDSNIFDFFTANVKHYFKQESRMKYVSLSTLSNKEIKKTLLASCAIPIMFKPVIMDGKKYYDGGVFERLPYSPLVEMGCDEIIAIDLFRLNFKRKKQIENSTIINIHPKIDLHGILDFSEELNEERFNYGYADAKNAMKKYEASKIATNKASS